MQCKNVPGTADVECCFCSTSTGGQPMCCRCGAVLGDKLAQFEGFIPLEEIWTTGGWETAGAVS